MLTAGQVMDALRLRYPSAQYALLAEVGNSTGFRCRRHADAVAVGLWPSRGMEIVGIEIKVRRSDWQKELEQPEKAEEIARYCDRWFLAVGDAEIVKEGELPLSWGLLVPKSETELRCAKDAPPLPDVKPLDRGFIAAALRKACEQVTPEAELKRQFALGKEAGVAYQKQQEGYELAGAKSDLERLRKQVKEFQDASGVKIMHAWNLGKIGEAVRLVANGTYLKERESLERLKNQAQEIAERIGVVLDKSKS